MSERLNNLARLTLWLAAVWLLFVGPAAIWGGGRSVEGLTYAALVCLVPGAVVVTRCVDLGSGRPLAGMVVSMGLRLALVVVAAVGVCYLRPDLRGETFVVWLVPCYLVSLAVETRIVLGEQAGWSSVSAAS